MSPKAQQVIYVIALLGLMAALAVGILAGPEGSTSVHSAGANGFSKGS